MLVVFIVCLMLSWLIGEVVIVGVVGLCSSY